MNASEIVPPKTARANVLYRQEIRKLAKNSKAQRRAIENRCKKDFFFWLETFAWLYEPRPARGEDSQPIIPFIPWPHQIPFMQGILDNFGYEDVGVEKSRGEGATWCCLMVFVWHWLFKENVAMGLVSLNENTADAPQNPDSLGAKIDWCLERLPLWMIGEKRVDWDRNITQHTWVNNRNESSIAAYPSTGNLATGGRKTAFMMDELGKWDRGPDDNAMASTEPVTNCRIIISTYFGCDGAYYSAIQESKQGSSPMPVFRLFWQDNPTRNKQRFLVNRKTKTITDALTKEIIPTTDPLVDKFWDKSALMLQKRGYDIDDKEKVWSPWYVDRCLRPRMTPAFVAQEYDINPEKTGNRFFSPELISTMVQRSRKPKFQGEVLWNRDTLVVDEFVRQEAGPFSYWGSGNIKSGFWKPPQSFYVIGGDIASGTGGSLSSNSSLSIVDADLGIKVAEYTAAAISPRMLAEVAIALCGIFESKTSPALLIWESNGYGGQFRDRVQESSFRHVYYRQPYKHKGAKPTREMGWWSNRESKKDLLGKYLNALTEGFFTNYSEMALREAGQYATLAGGKLEFVPLSTAEIEPSDEGENHGDRCIADALANLGMEHLGRGAGGSRAARAKNFHNAVGNRAPEGSFLKRRLDHQRTQRIRHETSW